MRAPPVINLLRNVLDFPRNERYGIPMNTDTAARVVFQNDRVRVWTGKRDGWFEVFDQTGHKFYGEVYATPCGSFAAVNKDRAMNGFHPTFFDAVEAL